MEEILNRIASSLDAIAFFLMLLVFVQFLILLFKDTSGGSYLSRLNETLKELITIFRSKTK